jgi:preprotein translocase subunit YajC
MNNLLFVLLMAPQGGTESSGGGYQMLIMMGLLVVVFYFFMIRPQMKKQKELKQFREELKVGDKVITVGGIYGKIAEISETTVILEVEGKMRLKVDKAGLVKDNSDLIQTQNQNK